MVDLRPLTPGLIICSITLFGFARCRLQACLPNHIVYLSEGRCTYFCPILPEFQGHLLCKRDGRTVVPCPEVKLFSESRSQECSVLKCELVHKSLCIGIPSYIFQEVYYVPATISQENGTTRPVYISPAEKPNTYQPPRNDLPRITFEEPSSQTFTYGILSFFFGVIAFSVFAVLFRFLYKRFQRPPVHVHTFSGHQLPLGALHLHSFLSSRPLSPQMSFQHHEQSGIPGLDLPPSYIVASELLDPPPSYQDISMPKGQSAQTKVTSL